LSSKPIAIWSLLAIPLFFLGVLLLLEAAGAHGRRFQPAAGSGSIEIRVIRTNAELYAYWKSLGLKGRIVIHAGRYLHYVTDNDFPLGYKATASYPVMLQSVQAELEKRVNHTNFLWVAVQANFARALYMLMTPEDYAARFSSESDYPERKTGGGIHDHDFGAPRVILDTIPLLRERVVLNLDASYFSGGSGEELLNRVLDGTVPADVITLCLSEENPDVKERERLQALNVLERVAAASQGKLKLLNHSQGLSK